MLISLSQQNTTFLFYLIVPPHTLWILFCPHSHWATRFSCNFNYCPFHLPRHMLVIIFSIPFYSLLFKRPSISFSVLMFPQFSHVILLAPPATFLIRPSSPASDLSCSVSPLRHRTLLPLCTYANSYTQSMCYHTQPPFSTEVHHSSSNIILSVKCSFLKYLKLTISATSTKGTISPVPFISPPFHVPKRFT